MPGQRTYDENSPAIQGHLHTIQTVIQRMASNSTSCKAWCVTVVSAVLVIVADKGKPQYALIALIPNLLFFALDTYYLTLEKMFRESYNAFIRKLHAGSIETADLYAVSPYGGRFGTCVKSLLSFSVWPFYLTLFVMIWIAKIVII